MLSPSSAAECTICLSEFAAGDTILLLTVYRHVFHMACIDSRLGTHTTCPIELEEGDGGSGVSPRSAQPITP